MNIITNLDIFFTIMITAVYIAFIFFAKSLDSKFIVFFISSFINIFSYSTTLKSEINFLTVVLLNLFFILTIVFFYIHVDTNSNLLTSDYLESSDIKNVITTLIFVFSFFIISLIFYSLNKNRNLFYNTTISNKSIVTDKNYYYKDSKEQNKQEKKEIKIDNINYVVYNRKLDFIENNYFLKHYNLIVLFYVILLVTTFIINNVFKNEG